MPRGTSPVLAIVFLGRAMLKFMMPSDSRDCLEAEGRLVSSMIRKPGA
jgi:hypothetical protein